MANAELTGRRALVTGATRGIGAAVAESLAAAGADVILTARTDSELQKLASDLGAKHGVRTSTLTADLSDLDAVEALAKDAVDVFGGLDILVNNAGISTPQTVQDIRASTWDATLRVNLTAPALLGARIGAAMGAAGGGAIINIASAAALHPLREHYAYSSSKAGLVMATKVLALELGPLGVRANVLCPTVILTEMGERVWGEEEKAAPMLARIPTGHFGVPADVANAVLFLVSPAADMINGVALPIDGGYSVS